MTDGRATSKRVRKYLCPILGHEWKGTGQIDRTCVHCGLTQSFLDQPGGYKRLK